jgi:hypothetical protein
MFAKGATSFKAGCDITALTDNLKQIKNKISDHLDGVYSMFVVMCILWFVSPFVLILFIYVLKFFGAVIVLVLHIGVFIVVRVRMTTLMSTLNGLATRGGGTIEAWNECVFSSDKVDSLFLQKTA